MSGPRRGRHIRRRHAAQLSSGQAGQEPLSAFRRYMATYARQQAFCFYDPALLANIERHWKPQTRRMG